MGSILTEKQYKHEFRRKAEIPTGVTVLPRRSEAEISTTGMSTYLASRELSYPLALANGWYPSYDAGDAHLRIVIPAINTRGYVYWQARAVAPEVEKRYRSPSYAASDSIIVVWPGEMARRVVLVEGPMDALAAAEHDAIGLAVMGKAPEPQVYDHILKLFPRHTFIVIPDSDGMRGAGNIVGELSKRGLAVSFRVSGAKDLAAMSRQRRSQLLDY